MSMTTPRPMRWADTLSLAFGALARHRVRAALTLLGIVVGTFALVMSVAVGRGIDSAVLGLFRKDDQLRRIHVIPKYDSGTQDVPESEVTVEGEMDANRRARLRDRLAQEWARKHVVAEQRPIDDAMLAKVRTLPHVLWAEPLVTVYGEVGLEGKDVDGPLFAVDVRRPIVAERLIAGRLPGVEEEDAALVHEYVAYQWGFRSDAELKELLGHRARFHAPLVQRQDPIAMLGYVAQREQNLDDAQRETLVRGLRRVVGLVRWLPLPKDEAGLVRKVFEGKTTEGAGEEERPVDREYTIVGVYRDGEVGEPDKVSYFDHMIRMVGLVVSPRGGVVAVAGLSAVRKGGYDQAQVLVDHEDDVVAVAEAIEAMGVTQHSLMSFLSTIRMNVMLISGATAFIAIIALVVAAIGIANTMVMSVLERTREIGILKALGARDGQVRGIFLAEGAALGFVGACLGLLLAWVAHIPGDAIARGFMEQQTHGEKVESSLFAFPLWLTLGAPALVTLIATLAAWYPAMRAAKVDPVTSLRHE